MVKLSQKEVEKLLAKQVQRTADNENRACIPSTRTKPKRDFKHGFARQAEGQKFDEPVVISFIHHRHRLIDLDNLFTKHIIDQIVEAGILADDSPKEVKEIRHTQIKTTGPEYIQIIIEDY